MANVSANLGSCAPDNASVCEKQGISENYWKYLVVSTVLLIVVYVPVFASSTSLSVYRFFRKAQKEAEIFERGLLRPVFTYKKNSIKYMQEVALGGHGPGNIIIIVSLLMNLAYFALYWRRTYLLSEICLSQYDPEWKIELAFTCYFIAYFFLRMFGGYQRREFWVDVKTIVDIITLPHVFVSIVVNRDWLGLRFLRIIWFSHIIDFLRQQTLFKSQRGIDILSLLSYFLIFWIASSGALYVLEVTGDPWHDFATRHCDLAFPDYVYFLIVTITTVGYGDISPDTEVGRIFVSLLIVVGIILVAYATPTISELLESYSQYSGSYTQVTDANHVVVSGHITAEGIKYFLTDFLHPDRKDNYTKVLILHPKEPDTDLKTVIRNKFHRVKYFKGSVMNSNDLNRVKIDRATAAIILTPNYTLNPESEDESNLMRVVSIKNTCNNTKVIVQVLQLHSLQQLVRIPSWRPSIDTAICKSALKLGLMAQNCFCPGISTLLSNLIYTTSESGGNGWQSDYMEGAGNEVYRVEIPEAFHGMLYEEVSLHCFMNSQLHMMLIAVDASSRDSSEQLIYPAPFGFTIDRGMFGYFIAQDEEQASALRMVTSEGTYVARRMEPITEQHDTIPLMEVQVQVTPPSDSNQLEVKPKLRQSGDSRTDLYHKCAKAIEFDQALLTEPTELKGHIVLCTFSEKDSEELNLCSFVSPLRSSTLQPDELKPIVIIGNKECIQAEWSEIEEYDKVFVIDGSPLDQDVLKAANVTQCNSCLILGSTSSLDEDPALIDKQPILCSLTLSSLNLTGKHINKVTELYREENVEFLDLEDDDDDASTFIAAQPFACGECISSSVFDSLVGVAYYNSGATGLFEKLVTGGSTNQTKPKLRKKSRRMTYSLPPKEKPSSYRPRFQQISLEEPEYEQFQHQTFANLFKSLIEQKKLCIGIYRRIDEIDEFSKRYVVTSPDYGFKLKPTDKIIVLESYK